MKKTPTPKLVVIEDLKPQTIHVKVGKDKFPHHVAEDGLVTRKSNVVADWSEYERPYEDYDAYNGHLPFSKENALREIYDQLDPTKTRELIRTLLAELKVLPNPQRDTLGHLRAVCLDAGEDLDKCQFGREVVLHNQTRRSIAVRIENAVHVFGESTGWGEFLSSIETLVEKYGEAYSLWLFIRWLQSQIKRHEREATRTSEHIRSTSTNVHSDQGIRSEKPKRINGVAQDKRARVCKKYDEYISRSHTKTTAIKMLVHDFRMDYCKDNPDHRKKVIQQIIRERNNKE